MDLALNDLQRLICHKTQQTKTNQNLVNFFYVKTHFYNWYYLPTPPLGQDMTQGQF